MEKIIPVATLDDKVLLINKSDIIHIGTPKGMEVKCLEIDITQESASEIELLEYVLKHNAWQELSTKEIDSMKNRLIKLLSEDFIRNKLEKPLQQNKVES